MKRRESPARQRDRGSVAVEFALLFPLVLLIVFGIIDFGRMLNAQITLTQAAREGSRLAALGDTQTQVTTRVDQAATSLDPAKMSLAITTCPTGAGPTANGSVVITYPFTFVTPVGAIAAMVGGGGNFAGTPLTLTGKGYMPCET